MACKLNFLIGREKRKKKNSTSAGNRIQVTILARICLSFEPSRRWVQVRVDFCSYIFRHKQGCFSWEMCLDRCKNHGCEQKKTEGTSSASFGVRTAAKCCELKRCADRVRSRTQELNI